MKGFILGFLLASLLSVGLAWAQQQGYITDQSGHVQGYLYGTTPQTPQNFMGPANNMQQQLNGVLQHSQNPC